MANCAKCGIIFTRRSSKYCSLECSGAPSSNKKHGMARSPEHVVWCDIKYRCHNPKCRAYPDYGGRGIVVWEGWRYDFARFFADVGRRPPGSTFDRIDNDKGYEPGNVRWTTRLVQSRNRRNVWPQADIDHMRYLLDSGYSFGDVAKMIGKTYDAVATKASKCGIRSKCKPFGSLLVGVSREG